VLAGGGVGIAPLHFFAARWAGRAPLTVFYGGKRAADLPLADRFGALAPGAFHLVTEDGSVGEKGLVTSPLGRYLAERPGERVYCCGPTPMMKAVCATAGDPARVWASLESRMACGIGICLGCALPVAAGTGAPDRAAPCGGVVMERVCREGPVFRADRIVWESLPD
jgi:dihydroorotate dehydrogenase electron transfer subunit